MVHTVVIATEQHATALPLQLMLRIEILHAHILHARAMCRLGYLVYYFPPLPVLFLFLFSKNLLRPLDALELCAHVLMLFYQFLLRQVVQTLVYE